MSIGYNPKIVTDGLVLCLDAANKKSYPGSGTTWNDLSGNGNNGTTINGVGYSSANSGSMLFDGVDDRVDISPTNFNLAQFSIECWIKSNDISTDYLRIIHKADTTSATKGFVIAHSSINGKIVFGYQPTYTTGEILKRSTTIINTGVFYHIAMTCDSASALRIYFNGIEDPGETSTSPDISWSSNPGNLFSIGSRAGGTQHLSGEISKVSVYNRALSTQEIQQNFNACRGRFGI